MIFPEKPFYQKEEGTTIIEEGITEETLIDNRVYIKCKSKFGVPERQTSGSSGFDIRANINNPLQINPFEIVSVQTGLFLQIPKGIEAQIRARSGLALHHGLMLVNGIGTIDSDYRGELKVLLTNIKQEPYTIKPGERIAQLVFVPILIPEFVEVQEIETTERQSGGFGHTGKC